MLRMELGLWKSRMVSWERVPPPFYVLTLAQHYICHLWLLLYKYSARAKTSHFAWTIRGEVD